MRVLLAPDGFGGTLEGAFDFSSLSGKVVSGVAAASRRSRTRPGRWRQWPSGSRGVVEMMPVLGPCHHGRVPLPGALKQDEHPRHPTEAP